MDLQMKYRKQAPVSGRPGPPLEPEAEATAPTAAPTELTFLGVSLAQVLTDMADGRKGNLVTGLGWSSSSERAAERRRLAPQGCPRLLRLIQEAGLS